MSENIPPSGGQTPYPRQLPPQTTATDNIPQYLIPTKVDGFALAAGYLGLFALIPIFAPIALIVGIIALNRLKHHPERTGKGRALFAVAVGGLMTVLLLILVFNAVTSRPA